MSGFWADFLSRIIVTAGSAFGGVYVLWIFFGKKFIEHKLSKGIERYKSELTEKTETLKTELSIYTHEQNVAISRVDAQVAKAVESVFSEMSKFGWVLNSIINAIDKYFIDGDLDFFREVVINAVQSEENNSKKLKDAIFENAIYFEIEAYSKLANFAKTTNDLLIEIIDEVVMTDDVKLPTTERDRQIHTKFLTFHDAYHNDLAVQYADIVTIFRNKLGIQSSREAA